MKKIIVVLLMAFMTSSVHADINKVLNYQGYLTDTNNQSILDGSYIVQFKLYDQATDGTSLWNEIQTLTVAEGYFNTTLGNISALSTSMFDSELWLGVQVGSDPEMSPRRKLGTAAYAMAVADDAITSGKIKDGEVKPVDIESGIIVNAWNKMIESYTPEWSCTSANWTDIPDTEFEIDPSGGRLLVFLNISAYGSASLGASIRVKIENDSHQFYSPLGDEGHSVHYPSGTHKDTSFSHILENVIGISGNNSDKYIARIQVRKRYGSGAFTLNYNDGISVMILELKN